MKNNNKISTSSVVGIAVVVAIIFGVTGFLLGVNYGKDTMHKQMSGSDSSAGMSMEMHH